MRTQTKTIHREGSLYETQNAEFSLLSLFPPFKAPLGPDLAARPRRCRRWRGFISCAGCTRWCADEPSSTSFSASRRAMTSRSF